ncbi:MAG: AraC family transcriptional regulator [Scytonema sp. RU_4_4]|nr:AraC family transcriptional regulator [Scytonema sp. RU_4_4]NJR75540.1 AraC family transcriptional regulator [Scytonema sp. CRU_2_7]
MQNAVSIKPVQGILDAARHCHVPIEKVIAAIGLNPNWFDDLDRRISHEMLCAMWQEITRRSGDPCIGLRLPEFSQPLHIFGYAILNSPNLGRALERMGQYVRLVHTGVELTLTIEGNIARFTHDIPGSPVRLPVALSQWVLATIVWRFRQATGKDWVPLQVKFQHPQPTDISAYRNLFRAPLGFNHPVDELVLDAELLKLPLLKADPALEVILDRHVRELLANLPKNNTFLDSVRWAIHEGLRCGDVGMEGISQRLAYSPRTFQRKLKEAGTSYTGLLEEMRQQLSVYYLREQSLAVSEIAFLLGFSENSAFHHAFKRWTGLSPGEFRLSHSIDRSFSS